MRSIVHSAVIALVFVSMPFSTRAQTVTFSAVGDVFFGRGGKEYGTEDPFRYVKNEFKGRDIVLGNLETPITATRVRVTDPPCTLKKNRPNTCETPDEHRYRRTGHGAFRRQKL